MLAARNEQLYFDLPVRPALGREDFFVAAPNAMALALVDQWPDWPGRKLLITGPAGAGKTHLAHVWANRSGARILPASQLADVDIPQLAKRPVAIEDAETLAGKLPPDNAALAADTEVFAADRQAKRQVVRQHLVSVAEGDEIVAGQIGQRFGAATADEIVS